MTKALDLTGQRFGKLVALEKISKPSKNRKYTFWKCQCDCGNIKEIRTSSLVEGESQSCGCKEGTWKHGMATRTGKTRLYEIWKGMRSRCNRPKDTSFRNYGGRGIRICIEWDDFKKFYEWSMQNGYDPEAERGKCTIDRINNNGNYEPDNCRWVDMKVQCSNRRPYRRKGNK